MAGPRLEEPVEQAPIYPIREGRTGYRRLKTQGDRLGLYKNGGHGFTKPE